MTVVVSKDIAASPDAVWSMVSDLTRMGEWSPENQGGEWVKGATGPAVGALFKGRNSNGKKSWSTTVKVNEYDPPRQHQLRVDGRPLGLVRLGVGGRTVDQRNTGDPFVDRSTQQVRQLVGRKGERRDRSGRPQPGQHGTHPGRVGRSASWKLR